MPFHPMWLPPPWWAEFLPHNERSDLVMAVGACLQDDGGFGNWPSSQSYLECCFQAFVALNALDAVTEFAVPAVTKFLSERAIPTGGFADVPGGYPTLFNTFYGVISCNILEMTLAYRTCHVDFISRCRVDDASGQGIAYACVKGWPPELVATYWAVAALDILRAAPSDDADLIAQFIDRCWDEESGAFGASPGHRAFMEYTYCALAIGVMLDLPVAQERNERLVDFITATLDEQTGLFGESPSAPGTLGDSLWAAACLCILGAHNDVDLRLHRRTISTLEPKQLWHLHCKLAVENYLDQARLRLIDRVINTEHVPVPDGYALISRDMRSSGSVGGCPGTHLDITERTLQEVSGILNEMDAAAQSRRPDAESQFIYWLEQLSREITSAFLPTGTIPDTVRERMFLELLSEPELLTIPLELATVDGVHLARLAAVGRLVRATSAIPHAAGSNEYRRGLRVLLLGGSHVGKRLTLPGVKRELGEIATMLRRVPGARVECIEGLDLVRSAVREAVTHEDAAWDIIHFAGHSFAPTGDTGSDVKSGLMLADGELELRVLLQWCDTKLPRLFVVHACASSRSKLQREGVTRLAHRGMAATLARAGTAYIGSYWPIRDVTSIVFVHSLYDSLSRGFPIGEAIRLARNRLRLLGSGPSAWAAYSLVGSPRMRIAPYEWRSQDIAPCG